MSLSPARNSPGAWYVIPGAVAGDGQNRGWNISTNPGTGVPQNYVDGFTIGTNFSGPGSRPPLDGSAPTTYPVRWGLSRGIGAGVITAPPPPPPG